MQTKCSASDYELPLTPHTKTPGVPGGGFGHPATYDDGATFVRGNVNVVGCDVYDAGGGIRPAFWLDMKSFKRKNG